MAPPLDDWKFLVGRWRGTSENQFGERGVVETTAVYALEPSDRFLTARGEAVCEGRLLNRSLSVMLYDPVLGKFRRKTFFSYGFVNNEVEFERTEHEIRFDVTVEPAVKQFEGLLWRSNLRKVPSVRLRRGSRRRRRGTVRGVRRGHAGAGGAAVAPIAPMRPTHAAKRPISLGTDSPIVRSGDRLPYTPKSARLGIPRIHSFRWSVPSIRASSFIMS